MLLPVSHESASARERLDQALSPQDFQRVPDSATGYPVFTHEVRLRRDRLARLDLAGLDRIAQDRRKLYLERRRVEVINCHAATVTDQPKHA